MNNTKPPEKPHKDVDTAEPSDPVTNLATPKPSEPVHSPIKAPKPINYSGHNNQRFFIWLTFYLSLSAGLCLIYNLPFAWQHGFVFFFFLWDFQEPDLLFRYSLTFVVYLNLFCFLMPIYMFFTQVSMVRKNTVMFDKSNHSYDLGVRRNFGQVLGHLSFWTCLSPAIKSRLPHVGTQWQSQASE